jgi:hypothetical protein
MDDKTLDEVLSLFFKGPNSTPAKIRLKYLVTVLRISNSRSYSCFQDAVWPILRVHPARFLNGKLDLSQAEAVADLISGCSVTPDCYAANAWRFL